MLRRRLLLLVSLGGVLWPAPPAGARMALWEGPVISDGVIAWLTTDWTTERFQVHVKRPRQHPVLVAAGGIGGQSSGPNWVRNTVSFDASDTHLALERVTLGSDEFYGDDGSLRLRAAPFGTTPLPLVTRCSNPDLRSRRFALSHETLAYEATPCGSTSMLAVRNLVGGTEWQLAQPSGSQIDAIRAAHGHVALSLDDGRRVQVVSVREQRLEYEIQVPDTTRLDDFDVSSDGSLALLTDRTFGRCDGRVTRYSAVGRPGARIPRACELLAALPEGIVLVRGRRGSRSIVHAGLTSSPPQPVVTLGRRRLLGADADGGRLVWAVRTCSRRDAIHITRLTQTVSLQRC